ncbi:MAG: histone deacetylase [Rhodobiaceae bacterium]|nr:histone deacetylase [Rhodobiaceae bacterium]
MPWIFHQDYDIPLPKNHRFSSSKFGDLYTLLIDTELSKNAEVFIPAPAKEIQLMKVHTQEYINKIKDGNLSMKEEKVLGLPWSETLSKRSYLAVNGTYLTSDLALSHGIACHLAGGTHHAYSNYGSGFCVFNDLAYAAKNMISEGKCKKVLIIDCDVHQGDGTADICKDDKNIFTCSIHASNNFPTIKAKSDFDIALDDTISDEDYLKKIQSAINICSKEIKPDLVLYDAGVDVHKNDKLGRLDISSEYMFKRDLEVLNFFKKKNIPIATVIGGGYSNDNFELAERHSLIFYAANQVFNQKI